MRLQGRLQYLLEHWSCVDGLRFRIGAVSEWCCVYCLWLRVAISAVSQRGSRVVVALKVGNIDVTSIDIAVAASCERGCIDGLPEDVALAVLVQGLLGLDPLGQGCCLLPSSEGAGVLHVSNLLVQSAEFPVHPGLALLSWVAPVAGVGATLLAKLTGHGVVDPADTLGHGSIDTRCVVFATSNTPSHNASLDIRSWVKLALADQGTASISLASVLAINSTSTDEGVVKLESLAKPGGSERGLALVMANNWQVDLLENNLVISCSSKLVLSPPGGKAALSVEKLFWLRKTDSVNVSLEIKVLRDVKNCPIIGEVAWVELWVDVQGLDVSVLVGPGFCLVLGVPFSTSDLQLGWFLLELGSTVGSSKDDPRSNEGTSTLVEVHSLRFSSPM